MHCNEWELKVKIPKVFIYNKNLTFASIMQWNIKKKVNEFITSHIEIY